MSNLQNQSDIDLIRSGRHGKHFLCSPSQTSPPTHAWPATNRADRPRLADRNLQALRANRLPLRRWTRARPQAISIDGRANWRASTARLCAECNLPPSRRVSWQLPQATGDAQRDLRDQCRASASPRESRLDGSGCRSPGVSRGGRHHRQHDRILSHWGRPATQPGRS
jgi:hypothetical protein